MIDKRESHVRGRSRTVGDTQLEESDMGRETKYHFYRPTKEHT